MPTSSDLSPLVSSRALFALLWLSTVLATAYVTRRRSRRARGDAGEPSPNRWFENAAVIVAGLFLAGIGFAISFESVTETARGWAACGPSEANALVEVCRGSKVWQRWPWALPLGIDSSILILDGIDLWLVRRRKPLSWLRLVPRGMVGVTIFLNVQGTMAFGDRVAHAALILNYAVVAHVLRHSIESEERDGRPDRVDVWQWLLKPRTAYGTWAIMRLEKLPWAEADSARRQRALTRFWLVEKYRPTGPGAGNLLARLLRWLRGVWSRGWCYVPADLRVQFKLGEYAALGRVAAQIAATVAAGSATGGNPVAGSPGGGVAGPVAGPVSGPRPAGSVNGNGNGNEPVSGLLRRPVSHCWTDAALLLAAVDGVSVQKAATVLKVAEALDAATSPSGGLPSNKDLERRTGISHTTCGKYKKELELYLGESPAPGVGEPARAELFDAEGGELLEGQPA
jgi:hypothetical protein